MANKVWVGTQTAFGNLASKPLDDEFFTTINNTYSYTYHDVGLSAADADSMSWANFITVNADGSCTPGSWYNNRSTNTLSLAYIILNKLYRGLGGNSVESLLGSKTVPGGTESKSVSDIVDETREKYFYQV